MKTKRLAVLDALRGIAAFFVMLFHFTSHYRKKYTLNTNEMFDVAWGHYGVPLFFIISGFVIFMSLNNISNFKDFIYKRFIRLYPTYWLCLMITCFVMFFFPIPGLSQSIKEILVNFTMIQGLFHVKNIDGSYWSLLPEILFYALMVFLIISKLTKKIVLVCSIWLAFIFLSILKPSLLDILLNLRHGVFFISGIIFYRIYSGVSDRYEHFFILVCLIACYFIRGFEYFIVAIIFFTMFYLFVYDYLNILNKKVFVFMGGISYPLYLLHQNIGTTIIYKLNHIGLNNYISIFVAVLMLIVLAALFVYFLEKPLLLKIKNKK